MNHNPMKAIHALAKRVAEETKDLDIELVRFVVVPSAVGPDVISMSFNLKPNAVKSSEEIASENIQNEFLDVLGDFTIEGDVETGEVTIVGGEAPAGGETKEEREFRLERARKLFKEMQEFIDDDDDE